MPAYVEIWKPSGIEVMPLSLDEIALGNDPANTIPLEDDRTVSRLHAVLVRYESGWAVRDLGSRNGTFVNGERVNGERVLRPGDELRLGATRLVFKTDRGLERTATEGPVAAPELTRREREVLLALCRPVLSGEMFTEPASRREIAADLSVSEDAVKQHLAKLFDKFGVRDGDRRRVRLANEAIRRGAVTIADLGPREA